MSIEYHQNVQKLLDLTDQLFLDYHAALNEVRELKETLSRKWKLISDDCMPKFPPHSQDGCTEEVLVWTDREYWPKIYIASYEYDEDGDSGWHFRGFYGEDAKRCGKPLYFTELPEDNPERNGQ